MIGQLLSGVSVVMCCIKVAAYVQVHMCRRRYIHAGAGAFVQTQVRVHRFMCTPAGAYLQVHTCRFRCGCLMTSVFRNGHSAPCHEVLVHT